MKHFALGKNKGYSVLELLMIIAIPAALGIGAISLMADSGPFLLHPGTEEAAQQMVWDNFSDVSNVGKPAITGNRLVTLTATIARKECTVHLYSSPDKLENAYGFKVKKLDCAVSAT